jgi:hypothetical protein
MSTQPKFNSKGQMIEELDEYIPIFMSPKGLPDDLKSVSPKRNNGNNTNLVSILGKRKFNDAFDSNTFDDSRYGQHIDANFFDKNVGHTVSEKKIHLNNFERKEETKTFTREQEQEILNWCEYYRANRNLFNV